MAVPVWTWVLEATESLWVTLTALDVPVFTC